MKKYPAPNTEKKAGLGERFVARFLDGLLIGIVFSGIAFFLGGLGGAVSQGDGRAGRGGSLLDHRLSGRLLPLSHHHGRRTATRSESRH